MEKLPLEQCHWIDEVHDGVRYGLQGEVLIDEKSAFQKITVIESKRYGTSLLLDGCWMTAEKQEKHYHECLVHPALCSSQQLKSILIIGGGDGGTARECLRYHEVEHLDLVEIDARVVEISKKYLPHIGGKAWTDTRLNLKITDGINWVKAASDESYDVILVDSSDPTGPAQGLFNRDFYKECRRILKQGGVFATQSESPESFRQIHIDTVKLIRELFDHADPLYGWVPMYPSGWWSWTFAAVDKPRYLHPILSRSKEVSKNCEIWSTNWQQGAFAAIPAFIERELKL